MIVSPRGEILAELGADPGIVYADLDMIALSQLRETFPVLKHRREL